MKQKDMESLATRAILTCLAEVPFLRPTRQPNLNKSPYEPDLLFKVSGKDKKQYTLIVMAKSTGQPRSVRDAIAVLAMSKNKYPNSYPVVVAPYISEQSADMCRQADVGYVDLKGNCCLAFDSVFIERTGIPNEAEKRELKYIYSPRAERVLRVLLNDVSKSWKTVDLAQAAGVSLGHVSNIRKRLEQGEFLNAESTGIQVSRPKDLLEAWSKNYKMRSDTIYRFWSPQPLPELEDALLSYARKKNLQCALTAFSAGALYAPMVIMPRLFAYCTEDMDKLATALRLKKVDSGESIQLIRPHDDSVFIDSRKLQGKTLVSPVQAYLDLMALGGRGEEAAKSIMGQVLKW
ncbi:MAG TPA: hypothetical protein DCL44_08360 [Elusimicrobia bacterium]|nr:hypothetical protein [Elusimicrobiota bacterium]